MSYRRLADMVCAVGEVAVDGCALLALASGPETLISTVGRQEILALTRLSSS
jgi:hypothetical protein